MNEAETLYNGQKGNYSENTENNTQGTGQVMKNQPKLIISSYEISPKIPKAGDNFDLSITLYNTNYENGVYNLKMTLDQSLEDAPATNSGENSPLSTQGTVFVPVDSSNTFYSQAIYPWQTTTKDITLNVLPNAPAGNYIMNVLLEYEDADGNQYEEKENIGIAVVQKSEITTSEINFDGDAMANSPTGVSMDIYNTGKDNLSTMMVKIEGDGFTTENDSYFIGNLQAGEQESFQATITPEKEGELTGKIIISYEDSTGQTHKEEKEFKTEVSAEMAQDVDENGNPIDPETGEIMEVPQDSSPMTSKFLIGGIILVIIIIIMLVRHKKKKNKQKEEELTIDE